MHKTTMTRMLATVFLILHPSEGKQSTSPRQTISLCSLFSCSDLNWPTGLRVTLYALLCSGSLLLSWSSLRRLL